MNRGPLARRRRSDVARVLAAAAIGLLAGCGSAPVAPRAAPDDRAEAARSAWDARRVEAWRPRRLKALYSGELSADVGSVVRGYLSVFWDGAALHWRVSAPLAGGARGGTLRADGGGASPFPGGLAGADAIGALLGALDLPAAGRPATAAGGDVRLALDDAGRTALLSREGRVLELAFPGGARVRLDAPSDGFPRAIAAEGPDGRAKLKLESLGPWPEDEPVPSTER